MSTLERSLPTIVFSIETMSREFDGKVVMATALASRGCRAIVGHKEVAQTIASDSRGIVWQGKSVTGPTPRGASLAESLPRNGSALMFLSDEGGIFPSDIWNSEILREHRIDVLRRQERLNLCTWGQRQRDVIERAAPELGPGLLVTGNPRFDLCKPEFAWVDAEPAVDRRNDYLPYILINTRFSNVVHANGYQGQFEMFTKQEFASQQQWFSLWRKDANEFVDFVFLIKELASRFTTHTIVIRPHPSESSDFYRAAFAAFRNVVVDRSENITYWIRKAALVVHNNCTTGIEAVLAGRPVLHFLPRGNSPADMEVAREAGLASTTVESALAAAERMLHGEAAPHAWSDDAKGAISNLTGPSIPGLVDATLRVVHEQNLLAPRVVVPRIKRTAGRPWLRRRSAALSYVESKRGVIDPARVEAIVSGGSRAGFGGARVVDVTSQHVVIEPA